MQNEQDLTPLLDTQQNQLGYVIAEGGGLDSKILAIAATNVAVLLFIAQASLGLSHWWQFGLLMLPFLASLVLNGLGLVPKNYLGASVDLTQHPEYLAMDPQTLVLQLLADTENAINRNTTINVKYWRYCLASILLTLLGAIVLFAIL
ncbi:MAG TPA: hypothetical protein VLI54_04550 [Bacillota bacterium]|nr:hypothetical protein [Bacillota bacterium]